MTTLYKRNKNGSTQQWSIELLTNGQFKVYFGQVDGAMQTQVTTCESKNLGRANATTPDQQAALEIEALIAKKLKSGYSYDIEAPVTVALPMKIKCYQNQLHNITFPSYSQFKYNGVNGLYRRSADRTLTLYSRGGEVYPAIPHLESAIHTIMDELNSNELNGELYIHNMLLQDIQSAVTKPNELSSRLTFIIFDISDSKDIFEERSLTLINLWQDLEKIGSPHIKYIGIPHSRYCCSHKDIESHYNIAIANGYEGTVIKLPKGLYRHNIRSSEQFKYKKALDAEFLITGFELDKRNHPVFILQSTNKPFKAKPKGTHEFLESIDPSTYIGKWCKVEYETLSKDGVPLKPVFIGLRNCNALGEPNV